MEKFSIHFHGSSAVNGCRQTSQYSTSNPHNSSLLINILWAKRLRVCKKQIHQVILTSNCSFWPKYESSIHNNASSSEKVHSLLSSRDLYWSQKHQFEIKNDLMDLLQSQTSPNLFRWGCKLIYILDVQRASRFELISIFLLTIPLNILLNQFFQKKKSNLTSVKTKKKKICQRDMFIHHWQIIFQKKKQKKKHVTCEIFLFR